MSYCTECGSNITTRGIHYANCGVHRREIEKLYWHVCALSARGRIPPPVPPSWMPDHYGALADRRRMADKRKEKALAMASKGPRWYKKLFKHERQQSADNPYRKVTQL